MATKLSLKQVFYIKTPPSRVFSALTESRWLTKWFLEKARFKLSKGAEYEFTWIGGWKEKGKVLDFKKDEKLVLAWPGPSPGGTKAIFTIRKNGQYSILTIRHDFPGNVQKNMQMWAGTKSGWAYYLMNLKSVLEYGRDLRHPEDDITG